MDKVTFDFFSDRIFDDLAIFSSRKDGEAIEVIKAACCENLITNPIYKNLNLLIFYFGYLQNESNELSFEWSFNKEDGYCRTLNIRQGYQIMRIPFKDIVATELFRIYVEELHRRALVKRHKESKKVRVIDDESLRYKKQQNKLRSKFFR